VPKTIVVTEGDCFINLSREEGFFWETLWNHPNNADLQQRRKHLNIIKPGDKVFVPDRELKELPKPTDAHHQFLLKGVRAKFTVTLMDLGKPRANEKYIFLVNGVSKEGTTDENGALTEPIPPAAREGRLLVGENQEEIVVRFGCVDPIEEISGVKTRLLNLGFYEGEIDDELTPETAIAIAEFQRSVDLTGEGELTDDTRQALVRAHGS